MRGSKDTTRSRSVGVRAAITAMGKGMSVENRHLRYRSRRGNKEVWVKGDCREHYVHWKKVGSIDYFRKSMKDQLFTVVK
jgi:hypothetical protein